VADGYEKSDGYGLQSGWHSDGHCGRRDHCDPAWTVVIPVSNQRFLAIVFAVLGVMFVLVIVDRLNCKNSDGTPCKFIGGRIR
jgi:hypothetical protein